MFDEHVFSALRSDEAYSGTAWLEIGAPVGKALAQLQVTLSLTPHCRVETWCQMAAQGGVSTKCSDQPHNRGNPHLEDR